MPIHIILPPVFDVGPNLTKALHQIGAAIVADTNALDELSSDMQARFAKLQAAGDQTVDTVVAALQAKHEQVMAAFAKLKTDLQAAMGQATDPASFQRFKDGIGASFDQTEANLQTKQDRIIAAIQGVDQPDAPASGGTDTGTGGTTTPPDTTGGTPAVPTPPDTGPDVVPPPAV